MSKNKGRVSGFTLIELLVVISIIGFLTTAAMVQLNSARIKARDAKRLATLQEVYKQFMLLDSGDGGALTGCTRVVGPGGGGNIFKLETCTGIATVSADFTKFIDPSAKTTDDYCSSEPNITKPCKYSIGYTGGGGTLTTTNFIVCTYLEGSVGGFSGFVHIDQTGAITSGCSLSFS